MSGGTPVSATPFTAIRWAGDPETGCLELLDQRLLPLEETWVACATVETCAQAITDMVVRGAPAIGVTAAWGVYLAARAHGGPVDPGALAPALAHLAEARPTAVNLRWAIERLRAELAAAGPVAPQWLFDRARALQEEDIAINRRMGAHGAGLLPAGTRILTHCNTGTLATAGHGTALGVIRSAAEEGRIAQVYACETRPYLQGARLTMWELQRDGLPATLITDSMAGWLMACGEIDAVILGADRIAANGDTANKIGTYALAVLARHHGLPFYVAAPVSTIDPHTAEGSGIPIEERSAEEVVQIGATRIAPEGAAARHPAFDVTPAELITAIVTEAGVLRAPYGPAIAALFDGR